MPHIIAVAAPIGGGKSALARAIAARLSGAGTVHFDHYEQATGQPVQNLQEWMRRGADFEEFVVPRLREDLERLRRGETVRDPMTGAEVPAGKYLVFENPLGREAGSLARFVDLLVWVEVPLEVALARKVRELVGGFLGQRRPEQHLEFLAWLQQYLENYLTTVRDVLRIQQERVAARADIVLDGMGSIEALGEQAAAEILKRLP
jgi:uridine kinase